MAANDVPCCEPMFWFYLTACFGLVAFAGLMSGLTLGLMSLSLVELEVIVKAGEPNDRKNASQCHEPIDPTHTLLLHKKILPLVKNQHLLLCTLLIGNALAMEIIPQAVCSRYGLSIGAKLSILVRFIVIVFFPLAYPISKLLDLLLGRRHSTLFRRAELKSFVFMHGNEAGKGGELTHDETTIISGALDMSHKSAKDAMTPVSKIFSLDIDSRLDEKTMGLIASEGHSRIPIYSVDPTVIIGYILVKNLIKVRPEDETPIRDLPIRRMTRVNLNLPLYDILNIFQTGRSHMAAVVGTKNCTSTNTPVHDKSINGTDNKDANVVLSIPVMNSSEVNQQSPIRYIDSNADEDEEVIGIITLEDVMEELIQEEIFDETDRYVEVHKRITINMPISGNSKPQSPETATWPSEVASPISPYRSSPLSPNIMISSTLLRSPINSPYRQSPFLRPTLYASPPSQPPSVLSPDRNDRYYYLSPSRVGKTYVKLPRSNGS
ncbi:hypothetical protein Bca101_010535 [Brassica carinata]